MAVSFTFNLQTKFEMSSFIRSKDVAWATKCRNGLHRHCSKGAQPMPKVVYRSSCRDKHNRPQAVYVLI